MFIRALGRRTATPAHYKPDQRQKLCHGQLADKAYDPTTKRRNVQTAARCSQGVAHARSSLTVAAAKVKACGPVSQKAQLVTATKVVSPASITSVEDARKNAIEKLARYVEAADAIGAVQHVYCMRRDNQLQTQGSNTQHVIEDTEVVLSLCRLIRKQHCWEYCTDILDLVLEMRYTSQHPHHINIGKLDVDPTIPCELIEAITTHRLLALPERRQAGLTALQVFSDFGLSPTDPDHLLLNIRICGFLSDAKQVHALAERAKKVGMSPEMQFELSLAYARCLLPDQSIILAAQLPKLSNECRIEKTIALSISYAEKAMIDQSQMYLAMLEQDESLWTNQDAYDRVAAVYHTRLNAIYAMALSLIPRMPFTENLHTVASARCSPRYSARYSSRITQMMSSVVADLRKRVDRQDWQRLGLHSHLFRCECMLFIMAHSGALKSIDLTLADLAKRLHSLQNELVRNMASHASAGGPQDAMLCGGDYASSLLRHFLWAVVFMRDRNRVKQIDIIRAELNHAEKYIPGFKLSTADLEPAFLVALPRTVMVKSNTGNFKENSPFMLADEFLCNTGRAGNHRFVAELMRSAEAAWRSPRSDHRLFPLWIMLAVMQGKSNLALKITDLALSFPQIRISHGSLGMVNSRDSVFYLRMAMVLSTFRAGADLAITVLRSRMHTQSSPVTLTERMAVAYLYCCVRSRNESVAKDIVSILEARNKYAISPRVQELYMRACIRSGQTSAALMAFRNLNYEGKSSQIGESSFVEFINYMADQRESATAAEHVFDVWLQIQNYQGRATVALVEKWNAFDLGRKANSTPNMLLPTDSMSVADALEEAGVPAAAPGSRSNKNFLRDWEYHMVMSLICAYINAGLPKRASHWELWIREAIGTKELFMKPELLVSAARLIARHLEHGTWAHIQASLDLLIAIDGNLGKGHLTKKVAYLSLLPAYRAFSVMLRKDSDGERLKAQIREYLEEHDTLYIFRYIGEDPVE
ncbi:hypothetical protein H4R20_001901 [Coemansia guatemalensis]|uniref:Uncharacterized protein n=1 Tax=Coemansia guatemalensis TaxID=2761395 RepID=A0A9W8I125_9FUNG|nr:hypothetical protein H4R20_001901 [Coemansia guatemalensis]